MFTKHRAKVIASLTGDTVVHGEKGGLNFLYTRELIMKIKVAAKAGNIFAVKAIRVEGNKTSYPSQQRDIDTSRREIERSRQAILQLMADKDLSRPQSEGNSPYALTNADLAMIPTPRSPDAGSFVPFLIEEIKKAARNGSVSSVKEANVAGELPPPGGEVDQYRQAILRAMAEKARDCAQKSGLKTEQRMR